MQRMNKTCSQLHEGHYQILTTSKRFTGTDTIREKREVHFLNTTNTQLVPFTARINNTTSGIITYIDSADHLLTYSFRDSTYQKRSVGSEYHFLIFPYFNQTDYRTAVALKSHKNYKLMQARLSSNDTAWIIQYAFSGPSNLGDSSTTMAELHLYKGSYIPFRKISTTTWQGLIKYDKEEITAYNFSPFDKSILQPDTTWPLKQSHSINKKPEFSIKALQQGDSFPAFTLLTAQGTPYSLYEDTAQMTILDFWYISCAPCIKLAEVLKRLRKQYPEKDLAIVGLNPYDSLVSLQNWEKTRFFNYPTCTQAGPLAKQLNIIAYPRMYVLDKNKHIIKVIEGYSKDVEEELSAIIQQHR